MGEMTLKRFVCNFFKNNQTVNIIVMTAPPRHDLLPSSCVNNEVIRFSRKLKKRMIIYSNVKILGTDLEKENTLLNMVYT